MRRAVALCGAAWAWLCGALLFGCGAQSDDASGSQPMAEPLPGAGVVHTPPANADSLHRVRAQLRYGDNPAHDGFERVPLGGWNIAAVLVAPRVIDSVEITYDSPDGPYVVVTDSCDAYAGDRAVLGCEPRSITVHDDVRTEAVVTTDIEGAAVFWLEQPGPYRFSSDLRDSPGATGCWWHGAGQWDGTTPEVVLEIGLPCT